MRLQSRTSIAILALTLALSCVTLRAAGGDNKSPADPTGTWKLTLSSTNTRVHPTAQTLKLKLTGGKLAGTLTYNSSAIVNGKARVSELPITNAKLQGNDISFSFAHPPAVGKGPDATYSYQGKISGDTMKGTTTSEWMGQTRERGWEAQRLKE